MIKAIDRLFQRFAGTYGAEFERSLGSVPISDSKSAWAYELEPFKNSLHRVAWALDNLPDRPPNAIAFKKLCRMAPAPDVLALPEPKADPARLSAELAKLAPLREKLAASRVDFKQWARVILETPQGRSPTAIRMAKDALEAA